MRKRFLTPFSSFSPFSSINSQSGVKAAALHIAPSPANAKDPVALAQVSPAGMMPRRDKAPPSSASAKDRAIPVRPADLPAVYAALSSVIVKTMYVFS